MLSKSAILLNLALLLSSVQAHFILSYPNTIGFNDDNEGMAPCGGFEVSFANSSTFHVGGDAIALISTHPEATWGFRATLDKTAAGNWTSILPVIAQTGLGAFCEPKVTVPESWAGKQGVIQIIQDAADGFLFQCAAVNFTTGVVPSLPAACKNVTNLQATTTVAPALSSILATAAATSSASSSMSTGTSTGTAAATTSTGAASNLVATAGAVQSLVWLGGAVVWAAALGL